VFGYFHTAAGLAAAIAPVSNAVMEVPIVRNLVAKVLGITDQRPFPKFSKSRFRLQRGMVGGRKIIFLPDAFARYIEPETEHAALEILYSCGYDVQVLPVIGAGASLFSKGFIEAAQRHSEKVLDALNKMDPSGTATIVGIEPPEVYFLKNEYIDLLSARSIEIEQRVEHTWLLDEFLLRSEEFNVLRIANLAQEGVLDTGTLMNKVSSARQVHFHPHCHQRAEGISKDGQPTGTNATVELLRSCGYEVALMDTGCCGMAGTFGYEAEHYELSMKVGELKLFPALRGMESSHDRLDAVNLQSPLDDPKSEVLSSGAACRMQIRQGTGVEAIHPIMLVAEFLMEAAHAKE
jgi:Fe-S oxidoreductase